MGDMADDYDWGDVAEDEYECRMHRLNNWPRKNPLHPNAPLDAHTWAGSCQSCGAMKNLVLLGIRAVVENNQISTVLKLRCRKCNFQYEQLIL